MDAPLEQTPPIYNEDESLTDFGREVDSIAHDHVNHVMDLLLAKGLTVKQAALLLYETVGFVTPYKILDKRDMLRKETE